MRGFGRWLRVGVVAAALAAGGCATRPHARDPLLHGGRGVWGDLERVHEVEKDAAPEPLAPPPAPDRPLIGSPLLALDETRPTTSP